MRLLKYGTISLLFLINGVYATKFAYVNNIADDTITQFEVDESTGLLTYTGTGTTSSPYNPQGLGLDNTGNFLYASNLNSSQNITLAIYKVDQTNGNLSPTSVASIGSCPTKIFPNKGQLYILDTCSRQIYVENVNTIDGTLSTKQKINLNTGTAWDWWVTPQRDKIYVLVQNGTTSSFMLYNLDPTGTLTYNKNVTAQGGSAAPIAFSPDSKYVYIPDNGEIYIYEIEDDGSFTLIPDGRIITNLAKPSDIKIDATGNYVYISSRYSDTVTMFQRDQNSGQLTMLEPSTVPTNQTPTKITIDSSNNFVYVNNYDSGDISMYTIDHNTGQLIPAAPTSIKAGRMPMGFVMQ